MKNVFCVEAETRNLLFFHVCLKIHNLKKKKEEEEEEEKEKKNKTNPLVLMVLFQLSKLTSFENIYMLISLLGTYGEHSQCFFFKLVSIFPQTRAFHELSGLHHYERASGNSLEVLGVRFIFTFTM